MKTEYLISMENPTLEDLREAGDDYWADFYYHPEKMNLEIVEEIDCGGSYEFDKVVVWRNKHNNELRWGFDSGCSCPSPFENIKSWDELEKLPETLDNMKAMLTNDDSDFGVAGMEFFKKVEQLTKRQ